MGTSNLERYTWAKSIISKEHRQEGSRIYHNKFRYMYISPEYWVDPSTALKNSIEVKCREPKPTREKDLDENTNPTVENSL